MLCEKEILTELFLIQSHKLMPISQIWTQTLLLCEFVTNRCIPQKSRFPAFLKKSADQVTLSCLCTRCSVILVWAPCDRPKSSWPDSLDCHPCPESQLEWKHLEVSSHNHCLAQEPPGKRQLAFWGRSWGYVETTPTNTSSSRSFGLWEGHSSWCGGWELASVPTEGQP